MGSEIAVNEIAWDIQILLGLGVYLLFGLVVLLVFEGLTGRIRRKVSDSSREVQEKMINTGQYMSSRTATIVLLLSAWMFWPAIIYGAWENSLKNDKNKSGGK